MRRPTPNMRLPSHLLCSIQVNHLPASGRVQTERIIYRPECLVVYQTISQTSPNQRCPAYVSISLVQLLSQRSSNLLCAHHGADALSARGVLHSVEDDRRGLGRRRLLPLRDEDDDPPAEHYDGDRALVSDELPGAGGGAAVGLDWMRYSPFFCSQMSEE